MITNVLVIAGVVLFLFGLVYVADGLVVTGLALLILAVAAWFAERPPPP